MQKSQLIKRAIIDAVATAAYVVGVACFMFYVARGPDSPSVIMPIAFLLLLILSASITGLLVFAKPVMLYLNGEKKEAVHLLIYTVVCLAGLTAIALAILLTTAPIKN